MENTVKDTFSNNFEDMKPVKVVYYHSFEDNLKIFKVQHVSS